jgi:hypothetical protein
MPGNPAPFSLVGIPYFQTHTPGTFLGITRQKPPEDSMKKQVPTGLRTPKKKLLSIIKHLEEKLGETIQRSAEATKGVHDVAEMRAGNTVIETVDASPSKRGELICETIDGSHFTGLRGAEQSDGPGVTFGPGGTSKRSSGKAAFWQIPFEILRELAHRFYVGRKYGVNNWKRAAEEGDIEFIRQLINHDQDHAEQYLNFFQNTGREMRVTAMLSNAGLGLNPSEVDQALPVSVLRARLRTFRDEDNETRFGHAIARVWGAVALAWYEYHYPELTAKAFYNDWRAEKDITISASPSTRQ